MQYRQVAVIGGKGTGPGQFGTSLRGIAVDAISNIYAANDSQITVFDAAGRLRRRWSTSQPAHSVAVAAGGAVYTGEIRQIEIFDGAGKLVSTWRDETLLGPVTAIGFVDRDVLVGDATGRAIRRFDLSGKFRNNIGRDNPLNGLLVPNGVVDFGVDARGIIHATNPGKHRVERYTPSGELLGHIGHFHGTDPAGFGGCCNPTNVAVGDRIYVTEKAGPRAKIYRFNGELEAVIAADVFDANCKNMSIAVDRQGRVYVADTVKLAIFVFEPVAV
ncbi:MAG TPA: NHL repeat-containing protein [Bryobacteraceae bacterium]|nr:NHL repeat-containing protein [Bryobacteraceae bacterium]